MTIVSLTDWNTFLTDFPNSHILQTGAWGELKSAFGWDPVRFVTDDGLGAQILFRHLPLGLTLAYLPKPVFSDQLLVLSGVEGSISSEQFWAEVDAICKKRRVVFLKIELDTWENEPDSTFTSHIAHRTSTHNIQPPRTIIVDLTGTEDEILARMKQKTRYNIRLAAKKGVTVRPWDDLPAFHQMMLVTGGRDGFGVHSLEYYRRAYELFHPKGLAELLVAEFEGKPLAASDGFRTWQACLVHLWSLE